MTDQKESPRLISPHGGYGELQSYQMAGIVHDATVVFCGRFISKGSRTHDQMVKVARDGKQNIAEGGFRERLCRMKSQVRHERKEA